MQKEVNRIIETVKENVLPLEKPGNKPAVKRGGKRAAPLVEIVGGKKAAKKK